MPNALTIQDLRKTYATGAEALKGIDLRVEAGDFFALLGPNGAGKSTAIGIICSLVNKTSGSVQVFGHDIDTQRDNAKSCIGLVPQEFNFNQFEPVIEIVINQAGYYGIPRSEARERAEFYVQKLGLWRKRRSMARELSGGMKRRLMIARALVHEPKLLILDEPTAGVDIEIRRSMWEFMRETNAQGTTIILTTHYLEEAENLCKNIAIINNGLMVEHTAMNTLLRKLHVETFLLNLQEPLQELPSIEGYKMSLLDKDTLSVEISREHTINDLFKKLDQYAIQVTSLRSKTSRLEEVFVRMMGNGKQ
ncbi:MAG: ABC transporter ATP-binding protein [Gammaproteobacteria bacterium]